jgi:predicted O-methyltransferase YrrM
VPPWDEAIATQNSAAKRDNREKEPGILRFQLKIIEFCPKFANFGYLPPLSARMRSTGQTGERLRSCVEMNAMNQEQWTAVDRYITETVVPSDAVLDAAIEASAKAELPAIAVTPNQGKLLQIFARLVQARRVLEIGTLGGYSTIWLARALPEGGRVISLELNPKHAQVARDNIERAGLSKRVEIRLGRALDTLPKLAAEAKDPFDLIFIDADKASIPQYFTWSLKLSRPGSVIIVDNVVRKGAVIEADSRDEDVQGVRRLNEMLMTEKRVTATTIQTVGSKGYDGFTLALVNSLT